MPIVFDQIDTAITGEQSAQPHSRGSGGGDTQEPASNPAMLADALRHELKIIEERRMRLSAD